MIYITKNKFEDLCHEVICEYINDLNNIQNELNIKCLNFSRKRVKRIYDYYEKKRLYIRRYFMNLESKPLDRHKIGAVMMYAILKSRPFHVSKTVRALPSQLLMANEYLAFYVALNIVELYKMDDTRSNKDKTIGYHLILPDTYHADEYVENVCKALYYVKNPDNFDIFAYANILFLLEKYSDKTYLSNKLGL